MRFVYSFLMLILIVPLAFAVPQEEVEAHFQKGLACAQQGNPDAAIREFQEVVDSDPRSLSREYYQQTVTESYFNLGFLYTQKEMDKEATQSFKNALALQPDHRRSLYYLAYALARQGEIAKAKAYYEKAKALGYLGQDIVHGDVVGEYLDAYPSQSVVLEYRLALDPSKTISVLVHGTPSGDEELIRDTISSIEKYAQIFRKELLQEIFVETVRHNKDRSEMIEKWTLGGSSDRRSYWVKYDFTPPPDWPGRVMIVVSDSELYL